MPSWDKPASQEVVDKTIKALKANGIEAELVRDGAAARARVLELIPEGAEVMTMLSETTRLLGITDALADESRYKPVRAELAKLDRARDGRKMVKLGAAPDYVTGSVHAVTQDGHLLIASGTGSQLGAYAAGASQVIWVVGTQKLVPDLETGMKRIYDYSLPLESKRLQKEYGLAGSSVRKILIVNSESTAERMHVIFVPENIGF